MGWSIESLANIFLEALGDIMAYTIVMVGNLSLDIGMNGELVDGRHVAQVPELGTLIDPTKMQGYFLDTVFPLAKSFTPMFMTLGFAIIAFIFLTRMAISFGGPFVKTESGGMIVARTGLAIIGTTYSYSIFVIFESLFNGIYDSFWELYKTETAEAAGFATPQDYEKAKLTEHPIQAIKEFFSGVSGSSGQDMFNMLDTDLIDNYQAGEGIGLTILVIAFMLVLLISFFKLVLEVYERYIIIGVMFYTAPLAFATLADKENSIFSDWVQMLLSEFVLMCTNLFFIGVFSDSVIRIFSYIKPDGGIFNTPHDFVVTMSMLIGWLIIGQQVDQHLKSLGLSTAQTGRGLGGSVAAGLGSAVITLRSAVGAIRGLGDKAGDIATGNTKWQRTAGSSGPVGAFFQAKNTDYGRYSKADASKKLADMRMGKDIMFKKDDNGKYLIGTDEQRGEAVAGFTSAALGQTTFDNTLHDMGKTRADIDSAHTTIDANGVASIGFHDGSTLNIQTPGTHIQGADNYGKAISGTDAAILISQDEAVKIAEGYASNQFGDGGYEVLSSDASLLKVGNAVEHVPGLIRGK